MQFLFRHILYATVFTTGAAVLIVEVIAVRVLSPYFGTSLYVLSSVLTTILAALSFGYYVGGRISDRLPSHKPLYTIITVSGISILLLEYVSLVILPIVGASFSVVSGPLLLSLLLFFLPAFLLGIVSPYVIKLQSLHAETLHLGTVVGATFFWGTIGSIAGSLASGFYLIPFIGITKSLVGTGLILGILGILGEFLLSDQGEETFPIKERIKNRALYLCVSLLLVIVLTKLILTTHTQLIKNVVYESEGIYSHILVYETNHLGHPVRALKRDTNNSSATLLDSYDLVFGYAQFSELYTTLKPDAKRYLLIGGGAYSIPRTLVARDEDLTVDVVEIEPVLFELAQEYFDLSDLTRINNHIMDGRVFLSRSNERYDVIFGDAFGTDLGVPNHLATREFFLEAKEHLAPNGVFLLNFIGTLYEEPATLTGSLLKTMKSVFPNVKAYAFNKSHPDSRQNIMVIARNGSDVIDLDGIRISDSNSTELSLPALELDLSNFDLEDEIIFTDDRAPLEFLMFKQY